MNESETKINYLINKKLIKVNHRWTQGFHQLMYDLKGRELFYKYLKSEGLEDLLNFWFACNGLKNTVDEELIRKRVEVIFKKFIMKSKTIQLTDRLKNKLKRIKDRNIFDINIFDEAQNEVEEQMKCFYEKFLRSKLGSNYFESISDHSLGATYGRLEDSLQLSDDNLLPNNKSLYQSYFRSKSVANPPNPYHVKSEIKLKSCVDDKDSGFLSGLISQPSTEEQLQLMELAIKQKTVINSTDNTFTPINDSINYDTNDSQQQQQQALRPQTPEPAQQIQSEQYSERHSEIISQQNERLTPTETIRIINENDPSMSKPTIRTSLEVFPPSAYVASKPVMFASILSKVLDGVKREQDSGISYGNYSKPKQILKSVVFNQNTGLMPSEENPSENQSILDNHCARVWDKTPNDSPTDQSIDGSIVPLKHNHRLYSYDSKTALIKNINNNPSNDSSLITVTAKYSTEGVPYKLTLTGPHITFRKFKQQIPSKPGNWQYFFKTKSNDDERNDFNSTYINVKITDDNQILPLIKGKIVAFIEPI
jgi:hypothetical protein